MERALCYRSPRVASPVPFIERKVSVGERQQPTAFECLAARVQCLLFSPLLLAYFRASEGIL